MNIRHLKIECLLGLIKHLSTDCTYACEFSGLKTQYHSRLQIECLNPCVQIFDPKWMKTGRLDFVASVNSNMYPTASLRSIQFKNLLFNDSAGIEVKGKHRVALFNLFDALFSFWGGDWRPNRKTRATQWSGQFCLCGNKGARHVIRPRGAISPTAEALARRFAPMKGAAKRQNPRREFRAKQSPTTKSSKTRRVVRPAEERLFSLAASIFSS